MFLVILFYWYRKLKVFHISNYLKCFSTLTVAKVWTAHRSFPYTRYWAAIKYVTRTSALVFKREWTIIYLLTFGGTALLVASFPKHYTIMPPVCNLFPIFYFFWLMLRINDNFGYCCIWRRILRSKFECSAPKPTAYDHKYSAEKPERAPKASAISDA